MNKLISTMKGFDITLCILVTVPFILCFLVFLLFYFYSIDKQDRKNDPDYMKHGLSRFILCGIFFIFSLILFDEVIEFLSAFATSYMTTYGYNVDDGIFKITDSLLFQSICGMYRAMPIDTLITLQILCTALYTGTEGIIAGLKTFNVDNNLAVELPAKKRKRLAVMFIIWCYLAVISTIYKFIIGSDIIDFYTTNIYIGCGVTLIVLILAERSPSVISERKGRVMKIIESDNVVTPDTYTNYYGNSKDEISDNNSEELLKRTFGKHYDKRATSSVHDEDSSSKGEL